MKKQIKSMIMAIVGISIFTACVLFAGALPPRQTTFTGESYSWTNDQDAMVYVPSVMFKTASAASNTVKLYYVDVSASDEYLIDQGTNAALQYVVFTPAGNGEYAIPKGDALKITHEQGSVAADITINIRIPE